MNLSFEKLIKFNLLEDVQKMHFKETPKFFEYYETSSQIYSTDKFIQELPSFPGSTDKIIRNELMSAIGATLSIEGTNISHEEIEESFRKADLKEELKRKEQEAENSRVVYKFINDIVKRNNGKLIYSEQIIKQIHKYFTDELNYLSNIPGEYRTDFLATFGVPRKTGLCKTRSDIELAMKGFIDWLNTDKEYKITGNDPIPKAIMAHYYLSEIHPFGDGNGRTARALEALVLYQRGINHYCFWSLANFWSFHKDEYIAHLGNIRATCDPWDFVIWGMKGFQEELKRIKNLVLKKVKQLMLIDYSRFLYANRKYESIKLNQRILYVLELLIRRSPVKVEKFVGSPEIKALYNNVSTATRYRDFKKLLQKGFIQFKKIDNQNYIKVNYQILENLTYRA